MGAVIGDFEVAHNERALKSVVFMKQCRSSAVVSAVASQEALERAGSMRPARAMARTKKRVAGFVFLGFVQP